MADRVISGKVDLKGMMMGKGSVYHPTMSPVSSFGSGGTKVPASSGKGTSVSKSTSLNPVMSKGENMAGK